MKKKKKKLSRQAWLRLKEQRAFERLMVSDPERFLAFQEWLQIADDKIFLVEQGVHMLEVYENEVYPM